jgi:hypothetical protein
LLIAFHLFHSPSLPFIAAKLPKKTGYNGVNYMQWLEKKKVLNYTLFIKESCNRKQEWKFDKCFQYDGEQKKEPVRRIQKSSEQHNQKREIENIN